MRAPVHFALRSLTVTAVVVILRRGFKYLIALLLVEALLAVCVERVSAAVAGGSIAFVTVLARVVCSNVHG